MLSINDQDKAVHEYLKSIGVSCEVNHLAEMLHDEWKHDLFNIIFKTKDHKLEQFTYKTGIGHRVRSDSKNRFTNQLSSKQKITLKKIRAVMPYPLAAAKHQTNRDRVQEWITPPTAASVLYSLLLDSDAQQYNFEEWADNYGYDIDSIKTLEIYKACLKEAKQLKTLFTNEQIKCLQTLLEDY